MKKPRDCMTHQEHITNNCAVAVCPCSLYQRDLVSFLKNKGHFVIGINPEKNLATELCDLHIQKDIFDVENIFQSLPKIKYIFTDQSDIAIIPCQQLAELTNTAINKMSAIEKFSCNKIEMYKHIKKQSIDVLDFEFVNKADQINLNYPFIIKPSDSSNSKGVYLIENDQDLTSNFEKSLMFSRNKILIAQVYEKSDFQITVEGICTANKHHCIASSYKSDYWSPSVCSSLRYPLTEKLTNLQVEEIYQTVNAYVESTGIDCCITHAEFIISNDGIKYLNEIGCRGGGFEISSKVAPWVSGIDLYENLYNYIINRVEYVAKTPDKKSAAIRFYNQAKTIDTDITKSIQASEEIINSENQRKKYVIAVAENSETLDKILLSIT